MNKARDRRLKATGKWFKKTKKVKTWTNHIFPVLLVISLILFLVNV